MLHLDVIEGLYIIIINPITGTVRIRQCVYHRLLNQAPFLPHPAWVALAVFVYLHAPSLALYYTAYMTFPGQMQSVFTVRPLDHYLGWMATVQPPPYSLLWGLYPSHWSLSPYCLAALWVGGCCVYIFYICFVQTAKCAENEWARLQFCALLPGSMMHWMQRELLLSKPFKIGL